MSDLAAIGAVGPVKPKTHEDTLDPWEEGEAPCQALKTLQWHPQSVFPHVPSTRLVPTLASSPLVIISGEPFLNLSSPCPQSEPGPPVGSQLP